MTSRDKELAFDIRPRYHITDAGTAQRNLYVEWISASWDEPYEYGGEYFGGYDSNGNITGGDPGYEGYGIDCSGLVSCGAYMVDADKDKVHDYNWSPWRQTTTGLLSVSVPVTSPWMDNILPGDIMDKPQHHVVTYLRTIGEEPNRIFAVIEAAGAPYNRVQRTDDYDPIEHYTEAELNANCTHTPPHHYEGRVLQ